jgi:hypothetical protein
MRRQPFITTAFSLCHSTYCNQSIKHHISSKLTYSYRIFLGLHLRRGPSYGLVEVPRDLDERLHRIYKSWRPYGFRIPASPTFFSHPYSTPNYEWKAILQVLPFIGQGLCTVSGRDVLVEWAVAFGDWVFATIWPEEHDDVTLERSTRSYGSLSRSVPQS